MSDEVTEVGARLILQDSAKFQASLDAATDSLTKFNEANTSAAKIARTSSKAIADGQAVVSDSLEDADASRAAAIASMDEFNDAQNATADVSKRTAAAVATSSKATAVAAGAAAAKGTSSLEKLQKMSTKVLKWSAGIGAVVGYEGIKNFMNFQQQIAQSAIDAGVKKSQLPAFTRMAIQLSDATGAAAAGTNSMADAMYRIASASPQLHMTTKEMGAVAKQVGNLYVLAGQTGDLDTMSRAYGAIISNGLSMTPGGKSLSYNNAASATASSKAINEWMLATTGHGDMKMGDLIGALGTGVLPLAKTFGISLNEVGAALDVLSPAMNANSASTRLKTALGMIASPSQKAVQGFELFGGNISTAGSMIRTKGLGGFLNYMSGMFNRPVTGKTFASAFYGGGLGSATGGSKGVGSGAGEYMRVLGLTPAQIAVMEKTGAKGFLTQSKAQLRSEGFGAGTTGKQAMETMETALLGGMFGGGRTGAAIMQLINEKGVYGTKLTQVGASETPASYSKALKIAYAEPIVAFHRFEQQLKNLTITVGKDVTPAFDGFLHDLEAVGSRFGRNKGALDFLLRLGEGLVAGAAVIKGAEVVRGVVTGARAITTVIANPASSLRGLFGGSVASMTTAASEVTLGGRMLQRASAGLGADDALMSDAAKGMVADDIAMAGGSTSLFKRFGSVLGLKSLSAIGLAVGASGLAASWLNDVATGHGKHKPTGPLGHTYVSTKNPIGRAIWDINAAGNGFINTIGGLILGRDPNVNVGDATWTTPTKPKQRYSVNVPRGRMNTQLPLGTTGPQAKEIQQLVNLGDTVSEAIKAIKAPYAKLFDGAAKQMQTSADGNKQASDTERNAADSMSRSIDRLGRYVDDFGDKVSEISTTLDPQHIYNTVKRQLQREISRR